MKKISFKFQLLILFLFISIISNAQLFQNGAFVAIGANADQINLNVFKFQVPVNSIFRGVTNFDENVKIVTGKKLLWDANNWQIPSSDFKPGIELIDQNIIYNNSPVLKFSNWQNYWGTNAPSGFDFVTDLNISSLRIAQGRIGINTNIGTNLVSFQPKSLLHVISAKDNFDGGILLDNNASHGRQFSITNTHFDEKEMFSINDVTTFAINYGQTNFTMMTDPDSYLTPINFKNHSRLAIDPLGNVGIGTINPDKKLTVKGEIHAEGITIDLFVPADYVFEKYYTGISSLKSDYKMPTLEEVEKYTKENNHLPEVPSAKEIQENGLNLGEMTNTLLQKIEELTLYSIEMQKQLKAQKEEIENLKNKVK